jgi:hypothetical protein
MNTSITTLSSIALILVTRVAHPAEDVDNNFKTGTASAQLPAGRFICQHNDKTGNLQVLTLNGRVLYRQTREQPVIAETGELSEGIFQGNVGCPWFLSAHKGYLLVMRAPEPPQYGAQEYLVIDFNREPYSFTSLGTGMRPLDDKIPTDRRVRWSASGLELNVHGYLTSEECCTVDSKKPANLKVYYDFASQKVRRVRGK